MKIYFKNTKNLDYVWDHTKHKDGHHYLSHLDGEVSKIVYAMCEKEVIGYVVVVDGCYATGVWVHPKFQRLGICKILHVWMCELMGGYFETDDNRSPDYEIFLQKAVEKYKGYVKPSYIGENNYLWNYIWELTPDDIVFNENWENDLPHEIYDGKKSWSAELVK